MWNADVTPSDAHDHAKWRGPTEMLTSQLCGNNARGEKRGKNIVEVVDGKREANGANIAALFTLHHVLCAV